MFLEAQHIHKRFGQVTALDDVSLQLREGTIFGLLGPNGAGKTTLIRIINRITYADEGTVLLQGSPMVDADVLRLGYLPEERGLYKKMKVGEQAIYLAQLKGLSRPEAVKRLHEWFDKFGISGWWNRRVEELSKGMQQKVQFIVTVLHRPQLLIFDEPFSGFDPVNAELLKQEILQLRKEGASIIFSTHNMASVEELCDDIVLINKSHVVLSGSVRSIKENYPHNSYEVLCRPVQEGITLPETFRLQQQAEGDKLLLNIELPQDVTANQLLELLMSQAQITSFREILPSMNDIFIQTVSAS